jgi:hypothetical protein
MHPIVALCTLAICRDTFQNGFNPVHRDHGLLAQQGAQFRKFNYVYVDGNVYQIMTGAKDDYPRKLLGGILLLLIDEFTAFLLDLDGYDIRVVAQELESSLAIVTLPDIRPAFDPQHL